LVIAAAGAGHGTYIPAAILFPYTMTIAPALGTIAPALIALALLQYPIYGLLIGVAKVRFRTSTILACVHGAFVLAALLSMSSQGSFW
jgi:hypothetical protein